MILATKFNTDTRGIGLLGVLCKAVEAIIGTCIKKVMTFHDVLHVFCIGRGMGTSIVELKRAQELASVDQDPIFLVFLDLRKS